MWLTLKAVADYADIRERQQVIHGLLLHHGSLKVLEIAEHLGISLATVRRDLAALERRGLLERCWGGASVRSPIKYLADFEHIAAEQAAEKRAIAAAAAALVEPGMTVGLSGGTTCTELARWLRGKPITVVTNAINVATELYNHAHTKVVVTGGALNTYSYELVGEMVAYSLAEYRLDLCFLGCTGLEPGFGFSMRDDSEAAVARAFLQASSRAMVIADHTKVGHRTLTRFAPLSAIERLITDEGLEESWRRKLREAGLEATLAQRLELSAPVSGQKGTPDE